jgi:hypothetical protein
VRHADKEYGADDMSLRVAARIERGDLENRRGCVTDRD